VIFPLARDQNLADVPDKALTRTTLVVLRRSESRQLSPAGQVSYFARNTAPTGWLKANGAQVSRTAYADLFAAIGTTFGAGDGFNTFNLPDLRGEFLRGLDDGRGLDGGRVLGSVQTGQIMEHDHISPWVGLYSSSFTYPQQLYAGSVKSDFPNAGLVIRAGETGPVTDATTNNFVPIAFKTTKAGTPGAVENRPRNVAMLACIKF
jgi:phage-related tail fiber protein